ncbi:Transcriptional repressor CTCFL [Pseudolycoriella hygida]|uniref:Transcriptional repressor CTCFL n=1 Tax=Pseudolycoriella hygida TaxID=35572 RepID=A0A9Q0RVS4_9DIPT|nr:Transcriptional repressor CTCFL [Pseudolycoriella hygida]
MLALLFEKKLSKVNGIIEHSIVNSYLDALKMFCLSFFRLLATATIIASCCLFVDGYPCPNDGCDGAPDADGDCCVLSGLIPFSSVYSAKRLNRLTITDSEIESIPPHIISQANPYTLHIMDTNLKTLQQNDFIGGENLLKVRITGNKIEKLEPNIFFYAPIVSYVDLSNNRIREVSEYAFENASLLIFLDLSNNFIQTLTFKSNLELLRVFMISNNSLTYLDENLLQGSSDLSHLQINDNQLNISRLNVFHEVKVFDVSNNPTSLQLKSKHLKIQNTNLKQLYIGYESVTIDASSNQIQSIVVDPQNRLIELNLSQNNYTTIQNLTALQLIERLDLSFNRIQDFSLTSFSNMTRLTELNLENSGLKVIDFGFFSMQRKLVWLDISYNNLKEIKFHALPSSINKLYIEGNNLTDIDLNDIAYTFPSLKVIGLSNNQFTCEKLTEIHREFIAQNVTMYVDEQLIVKYSRNVDGIACENLDSNENMELGSTKELPSHSVMMGMDHYTYLAGIQEQVLDIIYNMHQRSDLMMATDLVSQSDILAVKQEVIDMRNEGELKIIDAKADILMGISALFNVSMSSSNDNVDLKSTIEDVNKMNLERSEGLTLQLRSVNDKLERLVRRLSDLKSAKNYNLTNGESNDFVSLKIMMIITIVAIICAILGFLVIFYKKFYRPKYECDVCHARFTQSNSLKAHKLIHSVGDKPVFNCELCPTTCGRKTDLRIHVQKLHTADKPLKCKRCGNLFPDRYSYKLHSKTHEGEKCYKCELCPYASISARHLESHMLIHTDQKPFNCDLCEQSFRQKQLLKRHVNLYHNPDYVAPKPKEKNHKCPNSLCTRSFRHKGNLIRHMALHDPDSSVREEAMALKMGRRKRIQIIDGQQVEIYQSNDDSEEEEEEDEDDEEEYLDEVKPNADSQGKRKEMFMNLKGDNGQEYVVLEVLEMPEGEEDGRPKQEYVYDEEEEIEQINDEDPMDVDTDFIIGDELPDDLQAMASSNKFREQPHKMLSDDKDMSNCFGFDDDEDEDEAAAAGNRETDDKRSIRLLEEYVIT